MEYKMRIFFFYCLCFGFASCQQTQHDSFLSKEEMMKIVKKNDDLFSEGVKTRNAKLLANIYSDSAQFSRTGSSWMEKTAFVVIGNNLLHLRKNQ